MMIMIKRFIKIFMSGMFCTLLTSCLSFDVKESTSDNLVLYPDYKDITIPYNIAPLNFMPQGVDKGMVRFENETGAALIVSVRNGRTSIPSKKWRDLLSETKGGGLSVTVMNDEGLAYQPFMIYVAEEPVDKYVAYRLIAPGYKLWGEMGIYQRDLESFRQKVVIESKDVDNACLNCHSFANRDPEKMMMHVRTTEYGGTYVSVDGDWEKLDTKTPQTISALVYPSWHPSGRYIAYSVNDTKQTFHVSDPDRIEVYDFRSDVVVYDVEKRSLITNEALFRTDAFETFPSFSNDGTRLYFCSADSLLMPTNYRNLKYSLCSIGFDASSGRFGQVDTLVKAGNESVTMPRVSPDGRYLLYTTTEYGNFTIWHKDADLMLVNLEDRTVAEAEPWNSADAESFHSWSGNSRWVVFSTRRDDGCHTRLYLGYIGGDGTLGKAFLIPQKDPMQNKRLMKSYNIPEFVEDEIPAKGFDVRNAGEAVKVSFAGGKGVTVTDATTGASVSSVN